MVIHLDPNQLAVLDFAVCKVVIFSRVTALDNGNFLHIDTSGMRQVFSDIESMLDFYGFEPSNCQWMTS